MTPIMNTPSGLSVDTRPRNSVVDTLLSYGRAQTFMSGSNLASTPSENVFEDDDGWETDEGEGEVDESDGEWGTDRLVRAAAQEDDELIVGQHDWNDRDYEEPLTPTVLGPSTLPSSSPFFPTTRPRTQSRPRNYHARTPSQGQSRSRLTSNPTQPSSIAGIAPSSPGAFAPSLEPHPSSAPTKFGERASVSPPSKLVDNERAPLIPKLAPKLTLSQDGNEHLRQNLDSSTPTARKFSRVSARRPSMKRRRSNAPPFVHRGSSTFGQTVSCTLHFLSSRAKQMMSSHFLSALQFHCHFAGNWHAVRTSSFLLCWMDWWNCSYHLLWISYLLHVSNKRASRFGSHVEQSHISAKILGGVILSDPRLRTYADIGQAAFGPRSNLFTSTLFCLELFAVR